MTSNNTPHITRRAGILPPVMAAFRLRNAPKRRYGATAASRQFPIIQKSRNPLIHPSELSPPSALMGGQFVKNPIFYAGQFHGMPAKNWN